MYKVVQDFYEADGSAKYHKYFEVINAQEHERLIAQGVPADNFEEILEPCDWVTLAEQILRLTPAELKEPVKVWVDDQEYLLVHQIARFTAEGLPAHVALQLVNKNQKIVQ